MNDNMFYFLDIRSGLELVSKELNHLVVILHGVCQGFDFYEVFPFCYYYFSKRKGKYFYTFNHFYNEKSSKKSKTAKTTKGQLNSECLFDFLNFPKNHRKI